jgi:hypothetical protein
MLSLSRWWIVLLIIPDTCHWLCIEFELRSNQEDHQEVHTKMDKSALRACSSLWRRFDWFYMMSPLFEPKWLQDINHQDSDSCFDLNPHGLS